MKAILFIYKYNCAKRRCGNLVKTKGDLCDTHLLDKYRLNSYLANEKVIKLIIKMAINKITVYLILNIAHQKKIKDTPLKTAYFLLVRDMETVN